MACPEMKGKKCMDSRDTTDLKWTGSCGYMGVKEKGDQNAPGSGSDGCATHWLRQEGKGSESDCWDDKTGS